jgi:pimeloyl-ACP methyl ester carboxylesterase
MTNQRESMKYRLILIFFICLFYIVPSFASGCVVLLHGLARTSSSMSKLEDRLTKEGYEVANVDYPSRQHKIEELAEFAVDKGIQQCVELGAHDINFVTHSLGGILVRQYFSLHDPENVKRVVMLGPPNKGSEVVDNLKGVPGYDLLNGPAGMQLGTDSQSIPRNLGPVNFELGVIAGTQSINLILSSFLPNPDDGKVSVESAKIDGMCGFVSLPTTHPFMMKNDAVIEQVLSFLRTGKFSSERAITNICSGTNLSCHPSCSINAATSSWTLS